MFDKNSKKETNPFANLIIPEFDKLNSINTGYGLDVSDPDYIRLSRKGLIIEIPNRLDSNHLDKLIVTLKVYPKGEYNGKEVFRKSTVDLFDEMQVTYVIQKISERLSLETIKVKDVICDFIERLDNYRKHGIKESIPTNQVSSSIIKRAEDLLRSDSLLDRLENELAQAGIVDTSTSLQLFILSLSRLIQDPLHGVLQCPKVIGHPIVSSLLDVLPEEETIELTSISKCALSYSPTQNYWHNKTLVLHQLESIKGKGNTLLEYLIEGKSLRLVTQSDKQTGTYHSRERNVTEHINLISYTEKDYHPIFNSVKTVCIPIPSYKTIEDGIYVRKVKQLSGLLDLVKEEESKEVLQQITRELKSYVIYNPVIEEVDLSVFFGNNFIELTKYLKLVNIVTLVHQKKVQTYLEKGIGKIDVTPEIMIQTLELFKSSFVKDDKELYFNVRNTFSKIKVALEDKYSANCKEQTFTLSSIRNLIDISPVTLAKHIKTLALYGRIKRIGGTNKSGFKYKVVKWSNEEQHIQGYNQLIQDLKAIK